MEQISVFEAKTHLSQLLVEISQGKEFTITKRGRKVALLVPFSGVEKCRSVKSAIRAIKKLRKGIKLGKNLSIEKMR